MDSEILIFRLGHRLPRDERLTTHVFLVARAFGARGGIYSGQRDTSLEGSMTKMVADWGGDFVLSYSPHWRQTLLQYIREGWEIIHLTMYGLPHSDRLEEIRGSQRRKLIVIGGEKVPGELFKHADYNLSVTRQPHSEVAALAVFLSDFFGGRFVEDFGGRLQIKPSPDRKIVLRNRIR